MTVQPGAAVSNAGANVITLNNNNMVTNLGAISVDPGFSGITAGANNQIANVGTLTGGDGSTGITLGGSGGSVTNNGSIVAGATGFGINLNDNVASVSIINRGSIAVSDDGVGINATGLNNNNLTIVNTGTITFGGCGAGIAATGTGNTITNSGTLAVATCSGGGGGTGIEAGDSNTVTNTGTISVGDVGSGINGGSSSTLRNSGLIVAGASGAGLFVTGDNTTATNSGTLIVGDAFPIPFAGGIIGQRNNLQFSNTGTIVVGRASVGLGVFGGDNAVLSNSGSMTIGRDGVGLLGQGNNNSFVNTGTITLGRNAAGMFNDGDNATFLNTGMIVGGNGTTGMGNDSGNNPSITNTGTIILGDDGTGMAHNGDGGTLTNRGTIVAGEFGVGMVTQGSGVTLINSGSITVGADGTGIGSRGNNAVITNSGTVTVGGCGVGIDTSFGSGATINNSGRVIASGCAATGVSLGTNDTLTNTGVIIGSALGGGAGGSVTGAGGGNTILNSGTIDGPITLTAGGGNTLTNAGLITVSAPLALTGGVFHVMDGTFTQTATGTLALRVGGDTSPGAFDSFTVVGAGTANLGGTLRAVVQPGLYANTTTYTGALLFGSSTGTFASVQSTSLFFTAAAVYNPSSIDLVLSRLPFNSSAVIGGGTGNARAIGNVLEANYSTSVTGPLATFYSNLLASSSPNTLAQLTGEVATAPQSTAFGVFGQFLGTVFGQTATARANGQADGGQPTSLARSTTTGGGTRTAFAFTQDCASDFCDSSVRRVTAWAQGFGGAGSIDGNASTGSSRVDLSAAGGALGVDMQVTPNWLAGVTMGTTSAAFGLSDIASSGSARSIVLGVYGGYTQGPLYVDAALAYGYNTFNTTRAINTGSMSEVATGAFNGSQYGGRVEGGWRFAIDRTVLTPFAGLTVQALSQSGYSETSRDTTTGAPGVLGVTVQGQTATSVRSALGLQFETAIGAGDGGVLKPRLRLGWAHEFNTNRSATVALSVLPGAPFQVSGAQPTADSLLVGAGLELELGHMLRIYGQFDGDIASNARGFSGTGGIKLIW